MVWGVRPLWGRYQPTAEVCPEISTVKGRLKGLCDGDVNTFGEICAMIILFVPKLLFRKITKQEEKSLRYCFVEWGGRT